MEAQIRSTAWLTLRLQSWAVPSPPPTATVLPFGLNATENTELGVVMGSPIRVAWAGSVTFHKRRVSSPLPSARVFPLGLNTTAPTALVAPVRGGPIKVA